MATKTAEPIINAAYTQTVDEGGPSFPSLMASDYEPKINGKVFLGFPEAAWEILSVSTQQLMQASIGEATFREDVVTFYAPQAPIRWVLLGLPKIFSIDRDGNISRLVKGEKLSVSGKKTIAKLFLCAVIEDTVLVDNDGLPQVFTLKLKSTKTTLIGRATDKEGSGTIWALNNALRAHWKGSRGSWFTHQVSVELGVKPEKFTSKVNSDSSVGVMFTIGSGAKILSEPNQKMIFDLLQGSDLREAMADPFRISGSDEPFLEEVTISDENGDPIDGIPF